MLRTFLLFVLSCNSALAELPLSGRIFTNTYVPTQNVSNSELQQSAVGFWLEGSPRFSTESSARFSFSGDSRSYSKTRREAYVTSGEPNTRSLITDVREAYGVHATNSFEFKIGKQIIPWGKSDGINPTDFLSAKDLTFFNPDDEVRRIGAISTLLSYTPLAGTSPFNFQFVWTPVFPQYKLLIPQKTAPTGVVIAASDQPRITMRDTEVASKISYLGDSWDFSISGFSGWNHMPEFYEDSRTISGSAIRVTIKPGFSKMSALGSDFSFTVGDFIVRGEAAYKRTANHSASDPTRVPNYFEGVFGVERKFWENYRVQIQGTHKSLSKGLSQGSDVVAQQLAIANQRILSYQDKERSGGTFRLSYDNVDSAWKAELFVLAYQGSDYYWRPKVTYQWSDAFDVSVGADQYGGYDDRPLGSLHEFSAAFLEARYFF